jgi:hypothetical protein
MEKISAFCLLSSCLCIFLCLPVWAGWKTEVVERVVLTQLFREYFGQVVWFCKNYWWVILILLTLAVVGWITERKEKQNKKAINDKEKFGNGCAK